MDFALRKQRGSPPPLPPLSGAVGQGPSQKAGMDRTAKRQERRSRPRRSAVSALAAEDGPSMHTVNRVRAEPPNQPGGGNSARRMARRAGRPLPRSSPPRSLRCFFPPTAPACLSCDWCVCVGVGGTGTGGWEGGCPLCPASWLHPAGQGAQDPGSAPSVGPSLCQHPGDRRLFSPSNHTVVWGVDRKSA